MAVLACLVLALCLAACSSPFFGRATATPSLAPTATSAPSQTPSLQTSTRAATPSPTATRIDPTAPITLTLWVSPEIAASAQEEGQAFYTLRQAFEQAYPQATLQIMPKADEGAGSLVNLLLATQPVVPAQLPDLVALDSRDLAELVAHDLLAPLDEELPASLWDDLYPCALQAVTMDGQRMAMPFDADILLMVYNSSMIAQPPQLWSDLATSGGEYVFPTTEGDNSAVDAFLIQYLALGAGLTQDDGTPALDSQALTLVLSNYQQALEAGILPDQVREFGTLADCWNLYITGAVAMSDASSQQIQRQRNILQRTRLAQIPTSSGTPLTLAQMTVWGVVASDPTKRELAARFVEMALQPEYSSTWSTESDHLPITKAGLALALQADDELRPLADQQLQSAVPYPSREIYDLMAPVVLQAIQSVLDQETTAEGAALKAVAAVERSR